MRATAQAMDRHARAGRDTVAGTVRLGVSEVIGIEVMPAILASFRRACPEVVVELVLSDRNHDLLQRDVDIAVRMVPPVQEALLARRIGAIELGLYAHPSYLKRRGEPRQVQDLASYDLVGFDEAGWVRSPVLKMLCDRHTEALFGHAIQSVACNALHSVEARFSRWLLTCHDRISSDTIALTQEFLADMLGVQRTTVTAVARGLQEKGVIRYRRGVVDIIDRQALETLACECYGAINRTYERLLPGER